MKLMSLCRLVRHALLASLDTVSLIAKSTANTLRLVPTMLAKHLEVAIPVPVVFRLRAWVLSFFVALCTSRIRARQIGLRSPVKTHEFAAVNCVCDMGAD
jgi:hypothetical protein